MFGSTRSKRLLIALLIAIVALAVRLPGLGHEMTVDEEAWMLRSYDFWQQLGTGNLDDTFITTHPGVTPMWLIGTGEIIQHWRTGEELTADNLLPFRRAAALPIALAGAVLIAAIAWLLTRLWQLSAAVAAGMLLAADPYLVGLTTIAHLDGLLALLMALSLLAFFVWYRDRQPHHLVVGGIAAGLALLTKLVLALWLFPILVAVVLVARRGTLRNRLARATRAVGIVVGVAGLTFFALWPTLWVKDDTVRSFQRDIASVAQDEHIALDESAEPIAPQTFYLRTLAGRVPPHVQIVVIGALITIAFAWRARASNPELYTIAWLVVYAAGFLVGITLAAKKADRYAEPALVALPLIAGWGVGSAWPWLRRHISSRLTQRAVPSIVAIAVVAVPLLLTPYAIAYNNPLFPTVRPLPQQGWGEGLATAARLLNNHSLGSDLVVASWYAPVFRTYFNGTTYRLASRDDQRVHYVVTYRNMGGRSLDDPASNVLDEFADQMPAHTVNIQGVPYVWIYETFSVSNFEQHVGELLPGMEVGQTVMPLTGAWDHIDIGFATFSGRANTSDVVLRIKESPDAADVLREVTVNARDIADNDWQRFSFEPITDVAGKTFYVSITSPNASAGNAVTVRFSDYDLKPGEFFLRRRPLQNSEQQSGFIRAGDMAYRL